MESADVSASNGEKTHLIATNNHKTQCSQIPNEPTNGVTVKLYSLPNFVYVVKSINHVINIDSEFSTVIRNKMEA